MPEQLSGNSDEDKIAILFNQYADLIILAESLYNILMDSDEPETIKLAVAALTNTDTGRRYLMDHPITL